MRKALHYLIFEALAILALFLGSTLAFLSHLKLGRRPRYSSLSAIRPWYSDPAIQRDRSHVLLNMVDNLHLNTTRFVVQSKHGILHKSIPTKETREPRVKALYLTANGVNNLLVDASLEDILESDSILAWLGKYKDSDYWLLQVDDMDGIEQKLLLYGNFTFQPLREFGDRLESVTDAGILATANALFEFHKSHTFCSHCGSRTKIIKAGSCRTCLECARVTYPRIDVAAIMLITTACSDYVLLGRKKAWPQGRYSVLAGFAEVGETLEECCIRETFEESGVVVDPLSVHFVASQPWPFPKSLMVGFQAKTFPTDGSLPKIQINVDEMQDIQWFHRDYVRERLQGGSTALGYKPTEKEKEFHIPGRASLARLMITRWVNDENGDPPA